MEPQGDGIGRLDLDAGKATQGKKAGCTAHGVIEIFGSDRHENHIKALVGVMLREFTSLLAGSHIREVASGSRNGDMAPASGLLTISACAPLISELG